MWHGKSVSVVMATYREKGSVRRIIEEFFDTGFVDELIIVNNNAEAGTEAEVKKTRARMIHEPRQGYGYALRTGMKEASGDLVVLCEPDGSYAGIDIERMLSYSREYDVVFGSRTNTSTIERGSDMRPLRRFVDKAYGKYIELLFGTRTLNDVACTYKLLKKEVLREIEPHFVNVTPLLATETVLRVVSGGYRFIDIPVTYRKRVGQSTVVQNWKKLVKWALLLAWYITVFRLTHTVATYAER